MVVSGIEKQKNKKKQQLQIVSQIDVDANDTTHVADTLLQEMRTRKCPVVIAVLEDGYSEVIVNVMALALK